MSTLEQAVNSIVEKERFWAEVIIRMKRKTAYDIPTMGVSYDHEGVVLHVNPYFLKNLSVDEAAAIVKHECEHIGNDHLDRETYVEPNFDRNKIAEETSIYKKLEKMSNAGILNIAEDIAINQHIDKLPKTFFVYDETGSPVLDKNETIEDDTGKLIPNPNFNLPMECAAWTVESLEERLKKQGIKEKVKKDMPFEYYYKILKKHEEKVVGKKQLVKLVTLDDHDFKDKSKGEASITDPELQKEIAKNLLKEAEQAAKHKNPGCVPGHVTLLIEALSKKPKNWKKDISRFVAKYTSAFKESTRTSRNRRQRQGEPLIPGFRPKTKVNIAALFDISGSMEDAQLEQIVAELDKLHSMGVNIVVVQFDTEIRSIEKYKNSKVKIMGRGGTCFNPPLKKLVDKDFIKKYNEMDGAIFFTDGGAWEDNIFKPKIPVLWALNEGCKSPVDWGWQTEVKINAI